MLRGMLKGQRGGLCRSKGMAAKAAALTLVLDEKEILWDIYEAACGWLGRAGPDIRTPDS